jgi:hypothetical protein
MRKLLVLLSAVALVVAFTVPAMASDWNFYGNARLNTFMNSDSEERGPNGFEDDDLNWALLGTSRIGANVQAGDILGRFEYGTGVNLRLLYGTWNFGAGKLTIGQDYTPTLTGASWQAWEDTGMYCFGGVYGGRNAQIRVDIGGFSFAAINPNVAMPAALAVAGGVDTDVTLPKFEASYSFKVGPASVKVFGGYQTYEAVDANDDAVDVDSYVVGFDLKVGLGPITIQGDAYMGENTGQYGLWQVGADDIGWDAVDAETVDCDTTGYILAVVFKASDSLRFEGGYGYLGHELEGGDPDEVSAYYVQAMITLAKGVFVVPEIGKINYKENAAGNDEGDTTYYGAKWQINW